MTHLSFIFDHFDVIIKDMIDSDKYRMAGVFNIVKNSGDIPNNTLTSLSAVCYFHVTATVHC